MDVKKWFQEHSIRLLAIRDTPNAIAGGVAIGIFLGFTPLIGLKTLLSLLFAWLFRCNLLAAVIAVTLHDLVLPFMPFIFRMEYDIGYWLLSNPHELPTPLRHLHLTGRDWRSWTSFVTVGVPVLVGSLIVATPASVLTFFLMHGALARHERKRQAGLSAPAADQDKPDDVNPT